MGSLSKEIAAFVRTTCAVVRGMYCSWNARARRCRCQCTFRALLPQPVPAAQPSLLCQHLCPASDPLPYLLLCLPALPCWRQVGIQAGGIADNVLPKTGTITLNFRLLPGGFGKHEGARAGRARGQGHGRRAGGAGIAGGTHGQGQSVQRLL